MNTNERTGLRSLIRLVVAATVGASAPSHAMSFSVDTTSDAVDHVPGDGVCETVDGLCSLRAAVQEANALSGSHTISLSAGTYALSVPETSPDSAAGGDLDINDDLTVQGAGTELTILDAGYGSRLFEVAADVSLSVSSMTLQNGAEITGNGGAIFNNGNLVVDNLLVTANATTGSGGGIHHQGTQLTIEQSRFIDNTADYGGALFSASGTTVLSNTQVSANIATYGAGVYVAGGSTVFRESAIYENTADLSGGGIAGEGDIDIHYTTIERNSAGYSGGGVYAIDNGNVYAEYSLVRDNTLEQNDAKGAGLYAEGDAALDFSATSLVDNRIVKPTVSGISRGGAMFFAGSTINLTNVTISGNLADLGSGIYTSDGTVSGVNTTIAANPNGNIYVSGTLGNVELVNTLLEAPSAGGNCSGDMAPTSLGNNLDSDGSCNLGTETDIVDAAGISALQTDTFLHPLTDSSPAVDAGSNIECPLLDARGYPRNDGACDIGSYEGGAGPAQPGSLEFTVSALSVVNGTESVSVPVSRTSGADFPVSVQYATEAGSATSGVDYAHVEGTLQWANGDAIDKTLEIPLIPNDTSTDITFDVVLADPTGGAALGDYTRLTITITPPEPYKDNDGGGTDDGGTDDGGTDDDGGTGDPTIPPDHGNPHIVHSCFNGRGGGQGRCHKQGGAGAFDILFLFSAATAWLLVRRRVTWNESR